jgi:LPS sulfotransferase NodH/GT2 family glycosyltransferase
MSVTVANEDGSRGAEAVGAVAPALSYLICTLPRSGGTLLEQGLSSTGVAGRPEEFFWGVWRGHFTEQWSLPANTTDEVFLERARREGATPNGVFACKVHWPQFVELDTMLRRMENGKTGGDEALSCQQWQVPDADRIDRYLPAARYIYLTRRDKTAQAISLHRASTSGVRLNRRDNDEPTRSRDTPRDMLAIERIERRLRENDWRWVSYFARYRIEPLTITYEALSSDYPGTIRAVLSFLDLPGAEDVQIPTRPLGRQGDTVSRHRQCEVVTARTRRVTRNHGNLPATAVVVVSHNEGENLPRTVDALASTVPHTTDIVVVDDWSTDGSADLLADERVRVFRPPQRSGVAGARNFGAAVAIGDLLVFADAHVDPVPGWLRPVAAALSDPSVAAVAPAISSIEHRAEKGYGFTWRDAGLGVRWLRQQPTGPMPVPFLCGCFLAFRRDDFEAVGGFDTGMLTWGSEDAEICLHLWRRGRRCEVIPRSDVAHLFRPAFPYQVGARETLHNILRLAVAHFSHRALAAVMARASASPAFPRALDAVLDSDVWARREWIASAARHDGDWFLDRFRLSPLF